MELQGKYGTVIVYNDEVEETALSQIIKLINHPAAEGAHVRIMPDVHAGAGCVIGYTAKFVDKIVPNLIGVDIGCSVLTFKLGKRSIIGTSFDKLDKDIRRGIPSGRDVRAKDFSDLEEIFRKKIADGYKLFANYRDFENSLHATCKIQNQDFGRAMKSLGTLGGGNHFIEVGVDEEDNLWLTIHSGSRNFGKRVAEHHQAIAEGKIIKVDDVEFKRQVEIIKQTKKGKGIEAAIQQLNRQFRKATKTGLEYLTAGDLDAYVYDMQLAQTFARLNRLAMAYEIIHYFYKLNLFELEMIESVHNYINFDDRIIRKGAVSAHANEKVVIPFNMADGLIIGVGKGNEEWNNSAPHGAGRKMSRSAAKEKVSLGDFQKVMQESHVWSTCVGKDTLDESPQAYKSAESIIGYLEPTVEIINRVKPLYNFKACD